MDHLSVNWLAILIATVASMALGAIWYMALGKQWMAAIGKTREEIAEGGQATPFIFAGVCQLIMAYFIALVTPALMNGEVTAYTGFVVGVHMWFGFILMAMIINHRYQGARWSLTAIDGGYLLGVTVVQGIIIGLFGPATAAAGA